MTNHRKAPEREAGTKVQYAIRRSAGFKSVFGKCRTLVGPRPVPGRSTHESRLPRAATGDRSRFKGIFQTAFKAGKLAAVWCIPVTAFAQVDPAKLPPPAPHPVDFSHHIRPIFEQTCLRCHGPERPKSRFQLTSRQAALKGGEHGVDIVPGQSAKSPLIHYVARLIEDMEMPPEGKGDPLTSQQIGLLRAWIDQGVQWPEAPATNRLVFTASPTARWFMVDGDERQFREHMWAREGWAGGFQELLWEQRLGQNGKATSTGRVMVGDHQYQVQLGMDQRDLGFVRFGYEQYRRYTDDSGGSYPALGLAPADLGRDMRLDVGRGWADIGLTVPDWPRLTLGYEYQFKEGVKSSLQWDRQVVDPADPFGKAIYPAAKELDEKTHLLKFDLMHDLAGWHIEDNLRAEWYDLQTKRDHIGWFTPDFGARNIEGRDHAQVAQALTFEKKLTGWLMASAGYLYSRFDGEGGFTQEFFTPSAPALPPFLGDSSQAILIDQSSHVFNANALFGPWRNLTFSAGVQSDWIRQEGFGSALTFGGFPTRYNGNLNRAVLQERFGLRYTGLAYTVLFGEIRAQQEGIDHFERNFIDDATTEEHDFMRDTDATGDLKEGRLGFTLSPWSRVSWQSSVKRRTRENRFNHLTDFDAGATPGLGYPAFIRARDTDTDEIQSKVVLRMLAWLKTTFKYQFTATDYSTVTPAYSVATVDPNTGAPVTLVFPEGEVLAGNYDAHTYSFNAVLTPWRRLYTSATLAYTQSRLVSAVHNSSTVVPYSGDTYSALASTTIVLTKTTDLRGSYAFSQTDYGQRNEAAGLPLGLNYTRHGLMAGLTRHFKNNLTAQLQYGFFWYDEPTARGLNNYTAHAVFASVRKLFQ